MMSCCGGRTGLGGVYWVSVSFELSGFTRSLRGRAPGDSAGVPERGGSPLAFDHRHVPD